MTPETPNPEQRSAGREIHRLSNCIRRYLTNGAVVRHAGNNGRIICFLYEHQHEDVFQKDLEKEFGITRSTASKVVGLMEQKGLVCRLSVKEDARLKKLVLTDRSKELYRQMSLNGAAMERRLLAGFTPEETARLFDYLDRMRHNMA